jgi:hypothetical protein
MGWDSPPFTRIGANWQRQLQDGGTMQVNRGAIEVRIPAVYGRPRPDSRPDPEPPDPALPAPDDEDEDGDIATPKRDRDDEDE